MLLDRMREDAEINGICTLHIEAPESRSLPAIIAPQLHSVLLRLSGRERLNNLPRKDLER